MPGHRRAIPSIKFAVTHLYTWVERGTVRVKWPAQEHNGKKQCGPRPGLKAGPLDPACGHPPPIDATKNVLNAQTLVSKFVT